MTDSRSDGRLRHLEVLRGICIGLVVLFHLDIQLFKFGFLGVDVFFVLSGYLMARIYGDMRSTADVRRYLSRRAYRLLPAYLAVTFLTVVVTVFLVMPHEAKIVIEHALWAVALLPNVGYWMDNSYFDQTLFKPLLNYWSLGVELQFYVVFVAIVLVQRRVSWANFLLLTASLLLFVWFHNISPKTAFFLMPLRIWEFMAGVMIASALVPARSKVLRTSDMDGPEPGPAVSDAAASDAAASDNQATHEPEPGLLQRNQRVHRAGAAALCLLLLSVLSLAAFADGLSEHDLYLPTVWIVLLATVVIACGLPATLLDSPVCRALEVGGQYSYSIYLVHFPVIVILNYSAFAGTQLAFPTLSGALAAVVLIAVLSAMLYHWVEVPWRRARSLRALMGMLLASALVLCLAFPIAEIVAKRVYTPELLQISASLTDRDVYRCGKLRRILEPRSASCELTANSDGKSFLLVGDSHADAIKRVMADVFELAGNRLRLMKHNFAVGPDMTAAMVSAEVVARNIDVVVLHSSTGANDLRHVESLVEGLAESGVEVVYLAPVPAPSANLPLALHAAYQFGKPVPEPRTLDDYEAVAAAELTAVRRLAGQHATMRLVLTADVFCQPVCQTQTATGALLYFDSHHLTLTGARRLSETFTAIMQ